MDLLIDQPWNGIAAIAAFVTMLIGIVIQRDKTSKPGIRIFITVISAVVGIIVMAAGPQLQNIVYDTFVSGFPVMLEKLNDAFATQGSEIIAESIIFGLFSGTVTAVAALSGRNRAQRTKRGIIVAIASLVVYDTLSFAIAGWEQGTIEIDTFAIISDFFGGAIAGYLISLFIGLITNPFDVK